MKILTFDVEDWYHLLDYPGTATEQQWRSFSSRLCQNVDFILDMLDRHGVRATFFCLGWIAERQPEVILNIAGRGHEIGSHSHMHQLVHRLTPEEFRRDVEKSKKTLEDLVGAKVCSFRAPGFSITRDCAWAIDILIETGFEIDSSIFPARHGHGGYRGFPASGPVVIAARSGRLKEFPVSMSRIAGFDVVYSGGGYFRLHPYWLIRKLTDRADYVMSYFHPRDFDAGQPVLGLPPWRKFKSYVGLKRASGKFERWIRGRDFVNIATADKKVDWSAVPVVELP
jgi:polysaccharide deacetylase family protein (PEP-CTERM system associated)